MLMLYLSLSPGLVSSACSQLTVTLVSLSAVTLTSPGGLSSYVSQESFQIKKTYFGIVWTPSTTQARTGAVYVAQDFTWEAVMSRPPRQRSVQRSGTPASRQQGEWSRESAKQLYTVPRWAEHSHTGSLKPGLKILPTMSGRKIGLVSCYKMHLN